MARRAPGGRPPATVLRAIVVGHLDLGERDRIARLLTAERGRISAVARGARGSRRRFAGALDSGALISASVRPGRGDLWQLEEATLLDGRSGARKDLLRLTLLAYACELCHGLAREDHAEPRLFGLLEVATMLIDGMSDAPGSTFRVALEAKALTFAGLTPGLDRCVACGEPPSGAMQLDPLRGGALHGHCGVGGRAVSPAWLAAVEDARRRPLRDLIDEQLPDGPTWLLADMIEAQLHKGLNARKLLESLETGPSR